MKQHIMLDLETLGTNSQAVIVSIGAVRFDELGVAVGDDFYAVLNREQQVALGRTIDAGTVNWWMQQSEQARKVFTEKSEFASPALHRFSEWVGLSKDPYMWGNGADFDCVILGSLYDTMGAKKPWSYSRNRCFRTLKNIALAKDSHKMPEREGTYHNALDDAVYQAYCAVAYLNGKLK